MGSRLEQLTGAHGLVARRYEPLADGLLERRPDQTRLLQSLQKTHKSPGAFIWPLQRRWSGRRENRRRSTPSNSGYLTSTLAPASSIFFLMASASALLMPSLMGFGAPSTRSLASFRPRPVTSRTALMVLTLFSPAAARTTVNSVFSSAAAPPAAPPAPGAATATVAAAADTPNFSSMSLMSCDSSRTDMLPIASRISCLAIAICLLLVQSID